MSILRAANLITAMRLQEAADAMSSNEMRGKLSDAIQTAHKDTGSFGSYQDHTGDDASGDCIYNCTDSGGNSSLMKAPYSKGTATSDSDYSLDASKAKKVAAKMSYAEVPDEADHYAAMEAAKLYTPGKIPLCERFVSKSERDAAGSGDFAGKGKSFPILKKEDVRAAISSMGRAGSDNYGADVIKKNIKRIATAKGWASELPDSWGDGTDTDNSEAASLLEYGSGSILNQGSIIELKEGAVGQDGTLLMKVIAPGWGSSGYYSPEVLERDLPEIYPAGTKNFWNHQTEQEEAARPEGDLRDLASVTTEPVRYLANGPAGAGGYVRAKAFENFKQPIEDLHKHIGTSIRARGTAKDGVAPDGKRGRIIEKLTHGVSIDYVTTPGAGGKVLQLFEAARTHRAEPSNEGGGMAATELQKLQEANRNIAKRLAKADAREAAQKQLSAVRLPESSKLAIIERACADVPITEAGDFDAANFKKLIEAEIQYAAAFIPGGARAVGVGTADGTPDPKLAEAALASENKDRLRSLDRIAERMGVVGDAGKRIFREGRAAFNPAYNARNKHVEQEA